ncbi:hypothetical protein ISE1_1311 [plant metagenome]|uniref:Uncharacterized protein n=1 Tax=plant metagenome TaxID=1297885 RepID=A0A484SL52_9ZZZZ
MGRGHLGIRHQAELTSTRSLSAACWPASAGLFLSPGRPKTKSGPLGGQQAEGAAWGSFCRRAAPRQKAAPSGGSKPKARRGGFPPAGPPQDKKRAV